MRDDDSSAGLVVALGVGCGDQLEGDASLACDLLEVRLRRAGILDGVIGGLDLLHGLFKLEAVGQLLLDRIEGGLLLWCDRDGL